MHDRGGLGGCRVRGGLRQHGANHNTQGNIERQCNQCNCGAVNIGSLPTALFFKAHFYFLHCYQHCEAAEELQIRALRRWEATIRKRASESRAASDETNQSKSPPKGKITNTINPTNFSVPINDRTHKRIKEKCIGGLNRIFLVCRSLRISARVRV